MVRGGGRLARLDDPGAEVTDFGDDSFHRAVGQDPRPAGRRLGGQGAAPRATRPRTWTEIRYGTDEDDAPLLPHKVKSVTSPAPAPGKPTPGALVPIRVRVGDPG